MNKKEELYLAGNLGFSEAGRLFLNELLVPVIKNAGYSVLNPWAYGKKIMDPVLQMPEGEEKLEALEYANKKIGKTNDELIYRSKGIIAVLDGADVDSGTGSEIGFGCALGKTVLGYRGDFRLSSENIAAKVNIQVQYFIERNGGKIVSSLDELRVTLSTFEFR